MSQTQAIPVKNIYHMLCYAWNELDQSKRVLADSEEFDHIYNLFARIFINGTANIIKRGLNRNYIQEQESLSSLRGKINLTHSIKDQTILKKQMVCEYDDFSEDIRLNQIIKSTLTILLKKDQVDTGLKKQLMKLRYAFSDIQEIELTRGVFSSLRYNRHNHHYRMLLHISQLIVEQSLTTENEGRYSIVDFLRDRQMAKLFEKFILNFYKKHLNSALYKVHSPRINWRLDQEISALDQALLPRMQTDIVIEHKEKNIQRIIDAKFYTETLSSGYKSDVFKIRSGHLYQLLTYMNQSQFEGQVEGLLLYPTIEEDVSATYPIAGKMLAIETLNLNQEWDMITAQLQSLIPK